MGFLLRLCFLLALGGFVVLKSAGVSSRAPTKDQIMKESPFEALERAATARVADEAKKRCRERPRDCLLMLKTAGVEAARRAESAR